MKYKDLPVYKKRKEILKALRTNNVIVVESPTGSGKTTGIPMNDWAKHITAKTFVTKENVIGLQFLYDGKPLTEYGTETYQHKEARNIDRQNVTEEEYGKWEEKEVADFSKEAQAKLQELGIKDKTVWTKKGAEPSVDNIAPAKLANQLTNNEV